MRVLTVVYDLGLGGTQRAALNFANAYAELGHDSRIFATRDLGVRRTELGPDITLYAPQTELASIGLWDPEVVHLVSHGLQETVVRKLHKVCSPNTLWLEHNVFAQPSPWGDLVTRTFVFSQWCSYQYFRHEKASQSSLIVLPLPVAKEGYSKDMGAGVAFRRRFGIPEKAFVVGRVGQPLLYKWSPKILDAFEHVAAKNSDVWLLLKGAPEELVSKVRKSRVCDRVVLIDELPEQDMPGCYAAMDVMAHFADQGEAFGYVLAEAMLCEVPIVTVPTPWGDNSQSEVVGHGAGGLVATTYGGFVHALEDLMSDQETREYLGRRGRERVESQFLAVGVARRSIDIRHISRCQSGPDRSQLLLDYANCIDPPGVIRRALFVRGHFKSLAWVSGLHSFRWLVKSTLNRWGISRNMFSQRHS